MINPEHAPVPPYDVHISVLCYKLQYNGIVSCTSYKYYHRLVNKGCILISLNEIKFPLKLVLKKKFPLKQNNYGIVCLKTIYLYVLNGIVILYRVRPTYNHILCPLELLKSLTEEDLKVRNIKDEN